MNVAFSFSDLISGYVEKFDWEARAFTIKTSDGREFEAATKGVAAQCKKSECAATRFPDVSASAWASKSSIRV